MKSPSSDPVQNEIEAMCGHDRPWGCELPWVDAGPVESWKTRYMQTSRFNDTQDNPQEEQGE